MQLVQHIRVYFSEDESIFPEIVSNGIIDIWYFGDVILFLLWVVKFLPQFAPSTVH